MSEVVHYIIMNELVNGAIIMQTTEALGGVS